MTSIDELREMLEAISSDAPVGRPDVADAIGRARHIRNQRRGIRFALLAILVVGGTLIATGVGRQSQRVTLGDSPSDLSAIPQPVAFSRTLPDGDEIHGTYGGDTAIFGPFNDRRWWVPPASCLVPYTVVRRGVSGQHSEDSGGPAVDRATPVALEVGSGGWAYNRPINYFRNHTVLVLGAHPGDRLQLIGPKEPGGPAVTLDEATVDGDVTPLGTPTQVLPADTPQPSLLAPPAVALSVRVVDSEGHPNATTIPVKASAPSLPRPKLAQPGPCDAPTQPSGLNDSPAPVDQAVATSSIDTLVEALVGPGAVIPPASGDSGTTITTSVADIHWQSADNAWVQIRVGLSPHPTTGKDEGPLYSPWAELRRTEGGWALTHESKCALRIADITVPGCENTRMSHEPFKAVLPI